jgi:hypothetical protein
LNLEGARLAYEPRRRHIASMPHRKRKARFPDREIIAKAEGRFAKADKQRAGINANPKREVVREQARAKRVKQREA